MTDDIGVMNRVINEKKTDSKSSFHEFAGSFVLLFAVSFLVSMLVHLYVPTPVRDHEAKAPIVVADAESLVREQLMLLTSKVKSGHVEPEDIKRIGDEFGAALTAEIKNIAETEKVVVIRMDGVLGYDTSSFMDITPKIKQSLQEKGFLIGGVK